MRTKVSVVYALLAGALGIAGGACLTNRGPARLDPSPQSAAALSQESKDSGKPPAVNSEETSLYPDEKATVGVFERAGPSVVNVSNIGLRRDFFTLDIEKVPQGTGTGFVWDKKGHVVTNFHVIARANQIQVTLTDQSTWAAEVVGVAQDKDLAVLKIGAPADKLQSLALGRSEGLQVGMTTLAIGNPFGLDNTLTKGIISALGREITAMTGRTIVDVIQTDAAINPGNSGGPLLNARGKLIGVNTAILSRSGSSAGIGFAVPVKTVKRVVQQILEHGRVIQPGFGIIYLRDALARRVGLKKGVMIQRVLPGSVAADSGFHGIRYYRNGDVELGDIIVKIDDHEIKDSEDLLNTLDRFAVGQEVEVSYVRDRRVRKVRVQLQAVDQ